MGSHTQHKSEAKQLSDKIKGCSYCYDDHDRVEWRIA